MRKEVKRNESHQGNIKIKCPKCGKAEELDHLAGWSLIILGYTFCGKCKNQMFIKNVIEEE